MKSPRIIQGKYKGRKLKVPSTARPITDRVKRSLFDTISPYLENSNVMDVFAGSGSIGIEALSRGAGKCVFVEHSEKAVALLEENLVGINRNSFQIITTDYKKIPEEYSGFDFIFADPPFNQTAQLIANIDVLLSKLTQNGLLVLKIPTKFALESLTSKFEIIEQKKLGINTVYFIQKNQ